MADDLENVVGGENEETTVETTQNNDFFQNPESENNVFLEDYFPVVFENALEPEKFPYHSEDLIGKDPEETEDEEADPQS